MSSNRHVINFHGAIINAGDFLIQDSARAILKRVFPESHIQEFSRHSSQELSENAIGFYFGGPFLRGDLFPSVIPLQRVPPIPMGVGVLKETSGFNLETTRYFQEVANLYPTGRDLRATKTLKAFGCTNAKLGGCPALLAGLFRERNRLQDVSRIVVSDPSWGSNYLEAVKLVRILRRLFDRAEITFCFHRTIFDTKHKSFKASLAASALATAFRSLGVKVCDISGSSGGFSVYDGALHVGFRVHAHVYARSIGGASVLLTEDLRSLGMNELFGECVMEPRDISKDKISTAVRNELDRKDTFLDLQKELFEVTKRALLNNYAAI